MPIKDQEQDKEELVPIASYGAGRPPKLAEKDCELNGFVLASCDE